MYDFFKTSFPGAMSVEMAGKFDDGLVVKATCTLTYVKEALICRLELISYRITRFLVYHSEEPQPGVVFLLLYEGRLIR